MCSGAVYKLKPLAVFFKKIYADIFFSPKGRRLFGESFILIN